MPVANTEIERNTVTLDASVAIPWIVQEQSNDAIDALFQAGYRRASSFMVPGLWWWECGNVLNELVKRGRLNAAEAEEGLLVLRHVHAQSDVMPSLESQQRTVTLAQAHRLTYYDASYLELALRHGSVLATLDRDLRSAAHRAGVQCLDL